MSESESDKSEQATTFSLKRARDKGNVSRGLDLGFFTSLTAAALFFWISGEDFARAFSLSSSKAFVTGPNLAASQRSIFDLISYLFIYAARPILIFGACIFFIVAVFEVVQVFPVSTHGTDLRL